MIGNITKGSNFRPLLKYLLEKEKAQLVSSNMFGRDYPSLASEFKLSIALRPNVSQIVYHVSLSLDPKEKLNNRQWDELARKYLKGMGFESSQFVAVLHKDRHHQHLHLVTSLVDLNGKIVNTNNDYYRSQKVIRSLEKEYKIRQVPCSWELDRRQQTRQEIELLNRTWEGSVRRYLQQTIDELVDYKSPLTVNGLLKHLEEHDVSHQVHYSSTGSIMGLRYSHQGVNFSGTSLGKAYTFSGLQKHRGVQFNRQIEREIYNSCTIAPDTPQQTLELLQEKELQLQKLAEIIRQQQEQERQRIEALKRQKAVEKARRKKLEAEAARRRAEEYREQQRQLDFKRAELEKQRKMAQQKQEIKDLAPVIKSAISYTELSGYPSERPKSPKDRFFLPNSLFKQVDIGLTSFHNQYTITIKTNTQTKYDLSLAESLETGLNAHTLTIESNYPRYQLLLRLNYFDYNQPDLDNIKIDHNSLTEKDQDCLTSLAIKVEQIQTSQAEALAKAQKAIEQEQRQLQLENTQYDGNLDRLKDAVVKILSEKGRDPTYGFDTHRKQVNNLKSYYETTNFKFKWSEELESGLGYHQQLRLFLKDNTGLGSNKLIFKCRAETDNSCSAPDRADWRVTHHDLSEYNAQRIFATEAKVIKQKQIKYIDHYARMILISWGDRHQGSQAGANAQQSQIYRGDRYTITLDDLNLNIYSNSDDRGLIYQVNHSNDYRRHDRALANFNELDFKWFEKTDAAIANRIKEQDRQYGIEGQQKRQQQRSRGGFQL